MLEIFQKEMSIDKVVCIYHVFFLKQKLGLLNNMIDSENFAHLNRALMNVYDFLLMKKEEK